MSSRASSFDGQTQFCVRSVQHSAPTVQLSSPCESLNGKRGRVPRSCVCDQHSQNINPCGHTALAWSSGLSPAGYILVTFQLYFVARIAMIIARDCQRGHARAPELKTRADTFAAWCTGVDSTNHPGCSSKPTVTNQHTHTHTHTHTQHTHTQKPHTHTHIYSTKHSTYHAHCTLAALGHLLLHRPG